MRIAIVDDEPLSRELTRALLGEDGGIEIVGEADNGLAALALIADAAPDAVILDISMPGKTGIQTAIELVPQDIDIVFLTAHEEYAVDAFELGAADYVLKPLRRLRLAKMLTRLRERQAARRAGAPAPIATPVECQEEDVFWVPVRTGLARVSVESIQRVEAARDHVYFHTAERAYLYRITMAELESRMMAGGLIRAHRSAFVRPSAVQGINRRGKVLKLTLADNSVVPVGPLYKSQVLAAVTGAIEE